MHIGIASAACPGLTPHQLIDQVAALGYRGVEWRMAPTHPDSSRPWHFRDNNRCTVPPTPQAADDIRAACASAGLSVIGLSPYVAVGDVPGALTTLDLAARAQAPRVRLWAPSSESGRYADQFDHMRHFLDDLIPAARARGVQLAIEQHQRTICPSVSLAMRLVEHYAPEDVCVLYDVGNLAIEGLEAPRLALELLGRHLGHVQIKNATPELDVDGPGCRWAWSPLDSGVLPLHRIVSLLAQSHFADWLVVEDFSTHHSETDKLRRNVDLIHGWSSLPESLSPPALP